MSFFPNFPVSGTGSLVLSNGGTLSLANATGLPLSTGVSGNLAVSHLDSGTNASAQTFWRGDGHWGLPLTIGNTVSGATDTYFLNVTSGTLQQVQPTGTGKVVLDTNAVLTTPNLGTPSSINLSNATALPLNTGVSNVLAPNHGGLGTSTAPNADGQIPISTGTSQTYAPATLTAGTGISILPGPGSITITATGTAAATLSIGGAVTGGLNNNFLYVSGGVLAQTGSLGTGKVILDTGATLTNANLGTPSSINLSNASNLSLTSAVTGVLTIANGGTGVTTRTGTGDNVLSNSPVLVSPTLGTPTQVNLSNATNVPVANATGLLPTANGGMGANVTPTAANQILVSSGSGGTYAVNNLVGGSGITILTSGGNTTISSSGGGGGGSLSVGTTTVGNSTDGYMLSVSGTTLAQKQPTGTGKVVLDTNAVLTTPNLGTPSSINLANASGTVANTLVLGNGAATFYQTNTGNTGHSSSFGDAGGQGRILFNEASYKPQSGTSNVYFNTNIAATGFASPYTVSFTGTITGTSLYVSSVVGTGTLFEGMWISGSGVLANQQITSLVSGLGGSGSTFTVSLSQTTNNISMTGTSNWHSDLRLCNILAVADPSMTNTHLLGHMNTLKIPSTFPQSVGRVNGLPGDIYYTELGNYEAVVTMESAGHYAELFAANCFDNAGNSANDPGYAPAAMYAYYVNMFKNAPVTNGAYVGFLANSVGSQQDANAPDAAFSVWGGWQAAVDTSHMHITHTEVFNNNVKTGDRYAPGALLKAPWNTSISMSQFVALNNSTYYAMSLGLGGTGVMTWQTNAGVPNVYFNGGITAPNLSTGTASNLVALDSSGNFIKVSTGGGGGGGSLPSRVSPQITTPSLGYTSQALLTMTNGFKGYALYSIATSTAAWVRVYSSLSAQQADQNRPQNTDPAPGIGLVAEVVTTGNVTQLITPGVVGFSSEASPNSNIPITVMNLSGSQATITVTLTILQIEA